MLKLLKGIVLIDQIFWRMEFELYNDTTNLIKRYYLQIGLFINMHCEHIKNAWSKLVKEILNCFISQHVLKYEYEKKIFKIMSGMS